jgi:hypothetical protein
MKEYLDELDALLSDESKWIQGVFARDAAGDSCVLRKEDAACWCLIGAAYRVTPDSGAHVKLLCLLRDFLPQRYARSDEGPFLAIARWNDAETRTFADVKALIAKARAAAEAQP